MTADATPEQAAAAEVRQALDTLESHNPALRPVLRAFRPLMTQRAVVRTGLPDLGEPLPQLDPARLSQGVPLAGVEDFLEIQGLDLDSYLAEAARLLLPALKEGFPALREDVKALRKALEDKRLEARAALGAILSGDAEALDLLALGANLPRPSLEFMLRELAKPLLERRAEALGRLLADQAWELGSCPICGSLPELAFLKGDGGQRWLRCSACAHHWRFKRITCPVCGNEEPDQTGYLYAEGAERERVEVCRQCNKYLVALDIRGLDREPLWQVAALGLVHLDLLAQREGLTPAASCAWNNLG